MKILVTLTLALHLKSKLKKSLDEGLEVWAERVRKFELGYALQQLANGQDINLVMETMSIRIQNKILHPVIVEIKKNNKNQPFD